MIITADLLLDVIFLLLNDNSTRNQQATLELIKLYGDDNKAMQSSDSDLIQFYIRVIQRLISENIDKSDEQIVRTFMLKFKSDPAYDRNREVMDLLQDAVTSRNTMDSDQLRKLYNRIQTVLLWHHTNQILRRNFSKLNRASELSTSEAQQAELMSVLQSSEDMQSLLNKTINTGSISQGVDMVNMMDRNSIKASLNKYKARNVSGRLRTGLQGLNLMLGSAGGFVAGESVTFNALPHMYKSGILVSCAIWSVMCNIPVAPDGLKPMIYVASLENEAFQNMFWAFRQRYSSTTGNPPDGLTDGQIEDWLYDHFSKSGCVLIIERHLPHAFGFNEFMARVSYWRQQGFFIVQAVVDYANLMNKTSDDKSASRGGRDLAVRDLFSKLCNFTKNLGMIFITAHPINREGMKSISNQTNMVKRLGPEHLADSVDVEREVDVSIYMHLESNSANTRFLTMRINKHRYVDDTPEAHKYCAYPFTRAGVGILDDIDKDPMYTRDIYAVEYENNSTHSVVETIY